MDTLILNEDYWLGLVTKAEHTIFLDPSPTFCHWGTSACRPAREHSLGEYTLEVVQAGYYTQVWAGNVGLDGVQMPLVRSIHHSPP